jgi:hypothetical protein
MIGPMKRSMPDVAVTPAKQLDALLERFDASIRTLVRQARVKLRRQLPTAFELVYENRNAVAIGLAASERGSDTIVSLAVYARGVNLYFIYGVALADPHHLLIGSGNQGRFVRLESAAMLDRPEIAALIASAIAESETPLPRTGLGRLVIKSVASARPRASTAPARGRIRDEPPERARRSGQAVVIAPSRRRS